MKFKLLPVLGALLLASPALADIEITDAYARASGPSAKAGAAFLTLQNTGDADDRLIGVTTTVAKRAELHTHRDMGEGVMKMMEVEEGFPIPAGGSHQLARGGDHIMLMGLTESFDQGKILHLTLTFEQAGDIAVDIPVDLERSDRPADHGGMDHTAAGQGKMDH